MHIFIFKRPRACAITYNRELIGKYGLVATPSCVPFGFAAIVGQDVAEAAIYQSRRDMSACVRSEEIAATSCSIVNGFAIITLQGTPFDLHSYPLAPLT
jgi:hypothetical protein